MVALGSIRCSCLHTRVIHMIQGVTPQIESILAAGNQAYSNMNCQPWRFRVKGTHIEILLDHKADTSPYNHGARFTYLAIGTLLENITLAASELGYTVT